MRKCGGGKIPRRLSKCTCLTFIDFYLYAIGVYVHRSKIFDKARVYAQTFFTTVEESIPIKSDRLL